MGRKIFIRSLFVRVRTASTIFDYDARNSRYELRRAAVGRGTAYPTELLCPR
jgi:hypothetical protein